MPEVMVPEGRLELPRPFERQNLNLVRLPIPPSGHLAQKLHNFSIYDCKLLPYNSDTVEPKTRALAAIDDIASNSRDFGKSTQPQKPSSEGESFTKVVQGSKPPRKRDGITAWIEWHCGSRPEPELAPSANMIALTRGYVTFVDEQDFDFLASIKWSSKIDKDGHVYAKAHRPGSGRHGTTIMMHRVILGVQDPSIKVDHRDGDGLNNRRGNLRVSTNRQNIRNQRAHRDKTTSKFKGVSFIRSVGKFRAQIMINYRKINLGNFTDEVAAAKCYDSHARKLHGEFAKCNFAEVGA